MRKISFVLLVILLFALVGSVSAQGVELPTVPATSPVQGELEAALLAFFKLISDVTFVPVAAGFVIAATALLKKVLPATVPSGGIAISVQVIVWVVYVVSKHFGYADQFGSYIGILTTILTAVSGLVLSSYVATKGYEKAAANNVPLLGYQRRVG